MKSESLKIEIEKKRAELNALSQHNPSMLAKSQQLDKLILQYIKGKSRQRERNRL